MDGLRDVYEGPLAVKNELVMEVPFSALMRPQVLDGTEDRGGPKYIGHWLS